MLSSVNAYAVSPGRTIEKPMFGYATSDLFRVERIDLTPDSTVLHIRIPYMSSGGKGVIRSGAYTRVGADGEELPVRTSRGMALDSAFQIRMQSFRLVFPAVDPNAEAIDFVNGEGRYDVRIFDLELKEKQVKPSELAARYSGGSDTHLYEIVPCGRNRRSGSRILFRSVVFEGRVFAPRFETFGFR